MSEDRDHAERVARHKRVAELKTPEHIKAMAHYFHSLTEIYEYYRGFGLDVPKPFKAEMARAEAEMIAMLDEEANQGGALHEFYAKMLKEESKR